ncbi:alpha/beta fold hydrolase [Nocardia niigatensis]|uniref:alpha/beta fold hydrolase n=1 Tax=Nocardia niigatensis TaxID=209249 RepID=UPI0006882366|nr:alpha/beta hydrolase [Nocardia niigatensis]
MGKQGIVLNEIMSAEKVDELDFGYGSGNRLEMADGAVLYYEQYGAESGRDLVFLNNYFIVAPLWKNFSAELAKQYRVVAYDLRNQGESTAYEEVSYDSHLEDLRTLITELGVERPILVATSDSTLLAREFALRYPEMVGGLALFGPVFNAVGGRRRKRLMQSWRTGLTEVGFTYLYDIVYPLIYSHYTTEYGGSAAYLALKERYMTHCRHEQLIANLSAALTVDDDPARLRELRCPVLLAAGEHDFQATPPMLRELAELIPDARVETIPTAGHAVFFETTAEFEATIARFVESIRD